MGVFFFKYILTFFYNKNICWGQMLPQGSSPCGQPLQPRGAGVLALPRSKVGMRGGGVACQTD